MEERLKQIIRESKQLLMNRTDYNQVDTFAVVCELTNQKNDEGNFFSLKMFSGAVKFDDEEEPIILKEELISCTVEDFKNFLKKAAEKYKGQVEVFIPPICTLLYGLNNNPTVENEIKIIDRLNNDSDWTPYIGGIGFRIVDRMF